jgi:hypothetical protein
MTPIAFVPELHFETVRSWMEARGEAITLDALPQTGFIIPGKAAGFLYKTDSSVAMIEGLVAAPGVEREARDQAVDAIVQAVIAEAQRLGFKTLTGTTVLEAVVKRAERNGFVYVGGNFHVIIRPL